MAWWFSYTPALIIYIGKKTIRKTFNFFSIDLLFKTLLLPWKRDETDTTNMSLDDRVKVIVMNLVSRLVGATVRGITILIGLSLMVFEFIATTAALAGFILSPLVCFYLIFLSLT